MKKVIALSFIFCSLLMIFSCSKMGNHESSINENYESSSCPPEKVTINFIQYEYWRINYQHEGFIGTQEILDETKLEFDYNYFLNSYEVYDMMTELKYVVPPLNGGGYWFFTPLFVTKETMISESGVEYLEFYNKFTSCYLTHDMELYYGIYG